MTHTESPALTAHDYAVERDRLNDLCDAARERFRIARAERDHEDTIAGLYDDLRDLIAERDVASNRYRRARAAELAHGEALDVRAELATTQARRELANTIAQQAEALASGTFVGVESAHVDRLLANVETLRAWTPPA